MDLSRRKKFLQAHPSAGSGGTHRGCIPASSKRSVTIISKQRLWAISALKHEEAPRYKLFLFFQGSSKQSKGLSLKIKSTFLNLVATYMSLILHPTPYERENASYFVEFGRLRALIFVRSHIGVGEWPSTLIKLRDAPPFLRVCNEKFDIYAYIAGGAIAGILIAWRSGVEAFCTKHRESCMLSNFLGWFPCLCLAWFAPDRIFESEHAD